jgi:hypothetical protein
VSTNDGFGKYTIPYDYDHASGEFEDMGRRTKRFLLVNVLILCVYAPLALIVGRPGDLGASTIAPAIAGIIAAIIVATQWMVRRRTQPNQH